MGISRITRWVVSAASTAVVAAGLTVIPAASAAADTAPQEVTTPATPPTVSVDVLPTWQVNGVVWSQVVGLFPIEGVGPDFAVVGASVRG